MPELSLTQGGLFYRWLQRRRLVDSQGHIYGIYVGVAAWLVLAFGGLVDAMFGVRDALWIDPTIHVRLLVAIPLLLLGENILEARVREAMHMVVVERLSDHDEVARICRRAERLRDSRLAEGSFAALAIVLSQLSVWAWGASGIAGVDSDAAAASFTFSRLAYAAVGLGLVQFLNARWLWRWAVWTWVLLRLSRTHLATNALHPDRAAGLKLFGAGADGFAWYVASQASILSATWVVRIVEESAPLDAFVPMIAALVLIVIFLGCAPLIAFAPHVYRARCREVATYHAASQELVRAFRRRWMTDQRPTSEPQLAMLDEGDFSALTDLDSSFQMTESTRLWEMFRRPLILVAIGAVLPMIPLVLVAIPFQELAGKLGEKFLGL